jgi:hypothetical protein
MRAALSLSVLFALFLSVSLCVLFVHASQPSITEILNNLGYTNVANSTVETFPSGTYNITLYAEFTQYSSSNELSFYQVGDFFGNFIPVLEGSEGGYGYISPLTKTFEVDYQFGLSLSRNDTLPFRYFTESSGNIGGEQYAIIYRNLNVPGMFLIGFDDRNYCTIRGDFDYNDIVFSLQLQPARTQQYYLQVVSPYDTPSGGGWYDNGTNAFASLTDSIVNHGNGTRRVFTQWSGDASGTNYSKSDPIYMDQNKTATANWETQYYLTVVSPYATLGGQGWYDSGTTAYATLNVGSVDHSNGTRHVFTSWNGDASGTNYAKSNPITMDGPKTAVADWKTQYAVIFDHSGLDSSASGTVVTVNGSPVTYGQLLYVNWTDSGGSIAYLYGNVSSSITGKQFILINVTGLSSPTTVTSPIAVTGNYKTQYQVTFNQTGVGFDFTAAVVAVDSNGYAVSSLPASFWWDNSSSHTFSFSSPLIVNASKQCDWVSTSGLTTLQNGTLTVSGSGSVTGNCAAEYKYQVTFNQTGVNTDFTGTVVTIDGANYSVAALPLLFWWDNNSIHTFAYQSLLVVTPNNKQYVWISTSGLSTLQSDTIAVTASGSTSGNYKTQYYLAMATSPPGVVSPSGAGWYDAGTNATVSTVAFVDIVLGSSRYRFDGWTAANMTEIADPTRSPTDVAMDYAKTVTADYVVQYVVSSNQSGGGSDFTGTIVTIDGRLYNGTSLPYQSWWDNGSSHSFSYQSPLVATSSNKQYVWTSTTGLSTLQNGSITVTAYGSIVGNYKTQYYLTVASLYDSPIPSSGWFDSGTSITASVISPATGSSGTQYVCTGWAGTGSVPTSGTTATFNFTITQPSGITWNWKTQYYLTVTSAYGTTGGQDWYDGGATAYATLNTGGVDHGNGTRRVFTSWSGDASGANHAQSSPIVMNGARTAVASWKTQYTVAFGHSGLDASVSGTVATLNGSSITFGQLPYTVWVDGSSSATYAYGNVSSSVAGKRFIQIGITGPPSPITVTSPVMVTGNYKTQYQITLNQSGVGNDFTGTIVTIGGSRFSYGELPASFWWDSGSSHTFAFQSQLVVTTNGKWYVWTGTSGLSTLQNGSITVMTFGSVVGNSKTQYYLTVTSPFGTPGGQGWYDNGAAAYATLDTGMIDHGNGTRRVFTDWSVDASGIHYAQSDPIRMNASKTAIANWKKECRLIVRTSGLGTNNTKVYNNTTVLGTATDAAPYTGWFEEGSLVLLNIDSPVVNGSASYVFTQWSGDVAGTSRPASVVMDTARDVTANYELARVFPFLNQMSFIFPSIIGIIGGLILLLMLGLLARRRKKRLRRRNVLIVHPHV